MNKQNTNAKFYMHKISNLINVQKIVTIHYQELDKFYVSEEEEHNFWELIYADKKDIGIIKDGERIILRQGKMIFVKPNQRHYVESGAEEPNIFIISFDCRSESMQFFNDKICSVPEDSLYLLKNIVSEATETYILPEFDPELKKLQLKKNPNLGGEQVIKNSLELLLINIMRTAHNKPTSPEFFISKITSSSGLEDEIIKMLKSKIYDTFDLGELCFNLHYGKTYLCTFFRKKTGSSIYHTYLNLKTDEAKKLIRKHYSFADVSDKLCFDSLSHFNYTFKKYTGMTPKEYKASIK